MTDIPGSQAKIQSEGLQANAPVSEATWQAMGGAVNLLLANMLPVGSVITSYLDEATFQGETSTDWVLCDGRACVGSRFQSLTGLGAVPDMRSTYPRGKDNGRGLNPYGDFALGSYQADMFQTHRHSYAMGGSNPGGWESNAGFASGNPINNNTQYPIDGNPGAETRPKTTIVNFFVKIN